MDAAHEPRVPGQPLAPGTRSSTARTPAGGASAPCTSDSGSCAEPEPRLELLTTHELLIAIHRNVSMTSMSDPHHT